MRWWRVFIDRLTGKSKDPGVVGPRRRQAQRFGIALRLNARCSSWPNFVDLFTGNVSAGGLFIPTDNAAELGERVEVTLKLPDESDFPMAGTVVSVVTAEQAAAQGGAVGLGIKLDDLEGDAKIRFDRILEVADSTAPIPFDQLDGKPVPIRPSTSGPLPTAPTTMDLSEEVGGGDIDLEIDDDDLIEEPAAPSRLADATPSGALRAPAPEPALPPQAPGHRDPISFRPTPALGNPIAPQAAAQPAPHPSGPAARPASGPRPAAPAVHTGGGPIVGIDLGTTYSSVAAIVGNKVSILPWPDGGRAAPSVVSFPDVHKCIVGAQARNRLATDPAHTVASPKRLLGRNYEDREIQAFIGQSPYRCLPGPDGSVVVEIWSQQYAVTQLCAYILDEARNVAEKALGQEVRRCVMTVPVSFDEARAQIFRRCGQMARLEVVAMIDEPSSAALANRFDPNFGGVVGVYDFGGGTFDFSVVDVSGGDFQVLATAGDTWLGGDDFDTVIAEAAANQFWRIHKVDLRKQAVEWQKLVFACERAKRALSVDAEAAIFVPEVLRSADGMLDLNIRIDRATFERACQPVLDRSLATCDEALSLLELKPGDLTTIYLSGGTTYIPAVRRALSRHFGVPVRTGVPPEHAVCLGAAIHAAQIQYQTATTLDARG